MVAAAAGSAASRPIAKGPSASTATRNKIRKLMLDPSVVSGPRRPDTNQRAMDVRRVGVRDDAGVVNMACP